MKLIFLCVLACLALGNAKRDLLVAKPPGCSSGFTHNSKDQCEEYCKGEQAKQVANCKECKVEKEEGKECYGCYCYNVVNCCIEGESAPYGKKCHPPSDKCKTNTCELPSGKMFKMCVLKAKDCTSTDKCKSGSCNSATGYCDYKPKDCSSPDKCKTGSCNSATGACDYKPKDCSSPDKCKTGSCNSATGYCDYKPKDCSSPDKCKTGSCNSATGACDYKPKDCSSTDKCKTGSCISATGACYFKPKDCTSTDKCKTGSCNSATGACDYKPKDCSYLNPKNSNCIEVSCGKDGKCVKSLVQSIQALSRTACTEGCTSNICCNQDTPGGPLYCLDRVDDKGVSHKQYCKEIDYKCYDV